MGGSFEGLCPWWLSLLSLLLPPLYEQLCSSMCSHHVETLPNRPRNNRASDYRLKHESKESAPHPVVPLAILPHWWEADEQGADGGPGEYTKKPEWALNRLLNWSLVTTLGQWVVADWLIGWGKS